MQMCLLLRLVDPVTRLSYFPKVLRWHPSYASVAAPVVAGSIKTCSVFYNTTHGVGKKGRWEDICGTKQWFHISLPLRYLTEQPLCSSHPCYRAAFRRVVATACCRWGRGSAVDTWCRLGTPISRLLQTPTSVEGEG